MFSKKPSPDDTPKTSQQLPTVIHKQDLTKKTTTSIMQPDGLASSAIDADKGINLRSSERKLETKDFLEAKNLLIEALVERIDFRQMQSQSETAKRARVGYIIEEYISRELKIPLTATFTQSGY